MGDELNKVPEIPKNDLVHYDEVKIVPYFVWDDVLEGANRPVDQVILVCEGVEPVPARVGVTGTRAKHGVMIELNEPKSPVGLVSAKRVGFVQDGLPYDPPTLEINAPKHPAGARFWVRFYDLAEEVELSANPFSFYEGEGTTHGKHGRPPEQRSAQYPDLFNIGNIVQAAAGSSALSPVTGEQYVVTEVGEDGKARLPLPPLEGPWEWDEHWEVFPQIYPFKRLAAQEQQTIDPVFPREVRFARVTIKQVGDTPRARSVTA